jgi:hypothetical protein
MPVNMDPKKTRPTSPKPAAAESPQQEESGSAPAKPKFGETTERDREHALADAEWKNLWDATEVIDMDKW